MGFKQQVWVMLLNEQSQPFSLLTMRFLLNDRINIVWKIQELFVSAAIAVA